MVRARVRSLTGAVLWQGVTRPLSLAAQGVAGEVLRPVLPGRTLPPAAARTDFVQIVLTRHHRVLDRNAYWLSTQTDQVDWHRTIGEPQATMSRYADLTGLRRLPRTPVTVVAHRQPPRAGDRSRVIAVRITDPAGSRSVAFFLRTDLRRGNSAGTPDPGDDELLPVFWSADDTTLWPGESETVRVRYAPRQLDGARPVITVSGFNVPTVDAPVR